MCFVLRGRERLDSKKKHLWVSRRQGTVPDFLMLTVETPRWRPGPTGVGWVAELRRRSRCLRLYGEYAQKDPVTALARVRREFGISERTFWRWRRQYREAGLAGLVPESRQPAHSPRQTPEPLERAIIAIRFRTGWGQERIAQELQALGWDVSHNAVYGVLERHGRRVPVVRRGRKSGFRYQREVPNDLWHVDLKGPLYLGTGNRLYGLAILDDCSRFCVGAAFVPTRAMKHSLGLLEAAVDRWGAPRQLMSDNGTEFVGVRPTAQRVSGFVRRLQQLGVEHVPIRLRTPETNGKIERFWLTLENELLMRVPIAGVEQGNEVLARYLEQYNYHRRHLALGYRVPAEVYCPQDAVTPAFGDLAPLLPFLKQWQEAAQP